MLFNSCPQYSHVAVFRNLNRFIYAALEMEALLPELKTRSSYSRSASQRSLSDAGDGGERGRGAKAGGSGGAAPAQREGRMSTRGRVIVPAWQRSDIYEMGNGQTEGGDEDSEGTSESEDRLHALEFIKR